MEHPEIGKRKSLNIAAALGMFDGVFFTAADVVSKVRTLPNPDLSGDWALGVAVLTAGLTFVLINNRRMQQLEDQTFTEEPKTPDIDFTYQSLSKSLNRFNNWMI